MRLNEKLSGIQLLATDCDGVLTDGGLYYTENGDVMKKFNVLDGMGFLRLKEAGIKTAILTNDASPMIQKRAERLGVDFLITGEPDKLSALLNVCEKLGISPEEAAYIGDDCIDIPALKACGFGCAPPNAMEDVKEFVHYITLRKGGEGCFREAAEMILFARENA